MLVLNHWRNKSIGIFEKIPSEIKYVLSFFVCSRIVLDIIGVLARFFIGQRHGEGMQSHTGNVLLDIWGAWDTGYYMYLAQNWYPPLDLFADFSAKTSYSFFPFYPLLMRILGTFLGGNFYIAGLIISNVSLIIACIFLYKLVLLDADRNTALRSVKYLFLFPAAFIFSGVFTESLFVALAIICFYYAKKKNWFLVGVVGFFLALTKLIGVFIVLPLLFEYLLKKGFYFRAIKKDIFFLLLIPCGLILFSLYCHYKTGDFFIFVHLFGTDWGRHLSNPISVIFSILSSNSFYVIFAGIYVFWAVFILLIYTNSLKFSYWFFGMYSIILPLSSSSKEHLPSMLRYALVAFPFYILFAKLGKNILIDRILTVFLIIFQVLLMGFWASGFPLIV